jgi:Ku70/Ku80-like protein
VRIGRKVPLRNPLWNRPGELSDRIADYRAVFGPRGRGDRIRAFFAAIESGCGTNRRLRKCPAFAPLVGLSGHRSASSIYEYTPLNNPYYLVPDGEVGQQAFAVIREAIRKEGMVALGRVVFTSREHIIALEPRGKGLLGMTLRYPYEVRKEDEYFEDIPDEKIPKDMLELASHIVETKSGHFNPEEFEDHYEDEGVVEEKAGWREDRSP